MLSVALVDKRRSAGLRHFSEFLISFCKVKARSICKAAKQTLTLQPCSARPSMYVCGHRCRYCVLKDFGGLAGDRPLKCTSEIQGLHHCLLFPCSRSSAVQCLKDCCTKLDLGVAVVLACSLVYPFLVPADLARTLCTCQSRRTEGHIYSAASTSCTVSMSILPQVNSHLVRFL